jgi:two-component system, LytTR family, response regulator
MRYRTIIVEDEPLALERMERLLTSYQEQLEIIARAENGLDAVRLINQLQPDLVFLDIQMPELDGFGVLQQITCMPWIIFCTAYDQYALRAFNTNSLDYLLKPIEPERLKAAMDKLTRVCNPKSQGLEEKLTRLLTSLQSNMPQRLQVRSGDRIRLLPYSEIFFLKACDDYVEVHTFDETYLIHQTLNQLESLLPVENFVRIHRSSIINLNHLGEIVRWFSGGYRARMKDRKKSELEVSRSAKFRLGLR